MSPMRKSKLCIARRNRLDKTITITSRIIRKMDRDNPRALSKLRDKRSTKEVYKRDSANHSPISVVLDGSVTDA